MVFLHFFFFALHSVASPRSRIFTIIFRSSLFLTCGFLFLEAFHFMFLIFLSIYLIYFLMTFLECPVLATKSYLTLFDPMDCSLPGSSVHGISQARILEWVAISFSRGSSQTRDWTKSPALAGIFFTAEPPGEPPWNAYQTLFPHSLLIYTILYSTDREIIIIPSFHHVSMEQHLKQQQVHDINSKNIYKHPHQLFIVHPKCHLTWHNFPIC